MKIIKVFLAGLSAVWALALIPQLGTAVSENGKPHAFGTAAGSIFGILLASTISIVLFRNASGKGASEANAHVEPSKLSRPYNFAVPLLAVVGLAFEASSINESVSWATLGVRLGFSDAAVIRMFVISVWLGIVGFGAVALLHAVIVILPSLKRRIQPRWLSHVAFFLCLAHFCGSATIAESKSFQRYYQLFR